MAKLRYSAKKYLVGGAITILNNDGVRQWAGSHPIYEMDNKTCSKPPIRYTLLLVSHGWLIIRKSPLFVRKVGPGTFGDGTKLKPLLGSQVVVYV
jgi:hypothetical protein